jgi:exopolysaccharide biosynthesis polyprenyl glycosylphosphotransferase
MMRQTSIVADVVALLLATLLAFALRGQVAAWFGLTVATVSVGWPVLIPFAAVLGAFSAADLYERDVYASRPLHAWTIAQATAVAFVIAAAATFLLGAGWFNMPRLTLVLTFAFFPAIDMTLRLGALHGLYVAWVHDRKPIAYVVGDSAEASRLATRLEALRGFTSVYSIDEIAPSDRWHTALAQSLSARRPDDRSAVSVFIDSSSLSPREVLNVIETSQSCGVDAYVASGLLEPLETGKLMKRLFRAPVTRIRRTSAPCSGYALKRAFDILGSSATLLLLSPVIAILGLMIKLTSPGPVFLTQTRVGRSGQTFGFLKFRSMYVNSDPSKHEQYVRELINGQAGPMATDAEGNGVFHIVDDPRVTPVGRFIRKFSLDEIPQLWNVLRGDMSLVGPRPPLPYEAEEYDEWQRQRLEVQSGITGVWQIVGRNRVSFDEMTFQDLMYGMNTGVWVDLHLCLKTIPAALIGSGL